MFILVATKLWGGIITQQQIEQFSGFILYLVVLVPSSVKWRQKILYNVVLQKK